VAEILTDISAEGLRAAVETSFFETWMALGASPRLSVYDGADMIRYVSNVPFPVLNGVMRTRFQPEVADRRIEETLSIFQSQRLPMTWWTGPSTEPDDLPSRLCEHGLEPPGQPRIGLGVDLWQLNATIGRPINLEIYVVDNAELYDECQQVLNTAHQIPEDAGRAMAEITCSAGIGEGSPFRHYLGVKDDRSIATAMLSLAGGVAGIYNQGTLPEEHREGIEMAMTLTALYEARDMDYRIGVLQSTRIGFNMFRHLGFEDVCEIGQYTLTPPPEPEFVPQQP